jgi:hypothetical protein
MRFFARPVDDDGQRNSAEIDHVAPGTLVGFNGDLLFLVRTSASQIAATAPPSEFARREDLGYRTVTGLQVHECA